MTVRLLLALLAPLTACAQDPGLALPEPTPERLDSLARAAVAELVPVEGGVFRMGDVGARYMYELTGAIDSVRGTPEFQRWAYGDDDEPVHEVELSDYAIQPTEVTFAQYDLFTQATGRPPARPDLQQRPRPAPSDPSFLSPATRLPRHPVRVRSRDDAQAYCRWLGEQTDLAFDLPTEAQWEYAARSRGREVPFATDTGALDQGRNIALSDPMGLESVRAGRVGEDEFEALRARVVLDAEPVGTYPPNPLGLYDMSGNVYEVVRDWYGARYYASSPRRDPQGPATGDRWVLRGGANYEDIGASTTVGRYDVPADPDARLEFGFRCAVHPYRAP